jgi:CheY-like chemotaxis protein
MRAEAVKVVVVDDAKDEADLLAELLQLNGYEVRTASTAEEALVLIESAKPHCVLFDVQMPGMGGEALCRQLRDHHGDDIVLIAVSGYNDDRIAGSFAMADHFFAKPMDSDSLMSVLAPVK